MNGGVPNSTSCCVVGAVQALWRYPIKSMLGESCDALALDARGVVGDRCYAILDANGKLGSGKNTRRFRHIEGLFRFRAAYRGDVAEIRFPDGWVMSVEDPDVHDAMSSWLGQPVTVAREAATSYFDQKPIHILTTAALAWLRAALPDSKIDERRFRPNLLLQVPGVTQRERTWPGRTLGIGAEVRLRVTGSTERCGMISFAQSDLPHDPSILQYVSEAGDLQFGVYAEVVTPGCVKVADPVILLD